MRNYITTIQVILAVLLTAAILLQAKGTGLGSVFGGEGNVFRAKRGFEKTLFHITIGLAVAFFAAALLNVYLNK